MSWSFQAIGKPEKIVEALEAEGKRLTGASQMEFAAAKPHLIALVRQNCNQDPQQQPLLNFSASGHGNGESYRNCSVKLEPLHAKLLV